MVSCFLPSVDLDAAAKLRFNPRDWADAVSELVGTAARTAWKVRAVGAAPVADGDVGWGGGQALGKVGMITISWVAGHKLGTHKNTKVATSPVGFHWGHSSYQLGKFAY